jgi:GTP-binding protein
LRHLERTRVMIHLLDATAGAGRTPLRDWETLNRELVLYDAALSTRPQIVALNKVDLPDVARRRKQLGAPFARRGIKIHFISAATGEGVDALLESAWTLLAAERKAARESAAASPSPPTV